MKLESYLLESTEPTGKLAFDISKQIMHDVYYKIKDDTDGIDLGNIVRDVLNKYGFNMHIIDEPKNNSFFVKARTETDITFFVNKDELDNMIEDLKELTYNSFLNYDTNYFFKEFLDLLQHELLHISQFNKIPIPVLFKILRKPIEKKSGIPALKDYFSHYLEIEAYAQDIALELYRDDKSITLDYYKILFNNNDPIWKKLYKKIYFYYKKYDPKDEKGVLKKINDNMW